MTEIREKNQIFRFPVDWAAIRFDDPHGFAAKVWKCGETQCRVDLLAHDGKRLYLIEVKDFRGRQADLEKELDPSGKDALWKSACRKIRDSLMILMGAYRSRDGGLEPFCRTLFEGTDTRIDAILFLDRDADANRTATGYFSSANLRDRIAKQLRPLRFECAVLGQDTMPPDHPWSVRDAAPEAAPEASGAES